MLSRCGRSRRSRRAVTNIIATVLLVAMTLVAGVVLWTLKINPPSVGPSITFSIRAGTSNPVWGDPTDCLPWFPSWLNYNTQVTTSSTNTTATYYKSGGTYSINSHSPWGSWWNNGLANVSGGVTGKTLSNRECLGSPPTGDFSDMNSTQFIISSHTPSVINLAEVNLLFICNNTVFVNGSLAAMTWFPGSSTSPAPNAPHLGRCGSFVPSGSYSTLYNRFGIFVPVNPASTSVVADGDTFIMYVHTSAPLDPDTEGGNGACGPGPDCDDFHGAPAWCFTVPGDCTLSFYYTGAPNTLLASIGLYNIIRG